MPQNNPQIFTSKKHDWRTPKKLFDNLNSEYNFWIDLASDDKNNLCPIFLTEKQNALKQNWFELAKLNKRVSDYAWCNPPYGRNLVVWIKKAYEENKLGFRSVWLIPARTDTKFFHNFIFNKAEKVGFVKSRISFHDENGCPVNKATFPSMVVVYSGLPVTETKFYTLTTSGILI